MTCSSLLLPVAILNYMATVTRKIQIGFDVPKQDLKVMYDKWRKWHYIVRAAANMVTTHHFVQDRIKDFFYLTEETKVKLTSVAKDEAGILNTSKDNTTYRLLSENFKGDCPMGMLSGLNQVIAKTYKKESKDIWMGKRSIRSYRNNIPMPVRFADISRWEKTKDCNYKFFVYGTSFKTWFGKDFSGNEEIMDRAMNGDYKLCDSSIQFDGKKMFLLAVFSFDKDKVDLDKGKVADCHLSLQYPIVIKEKKDKMFTIGSAEEYLHQRLAIKGAMRRIQKAARYNNGGRGRERKLQALDRFEKAEKNYVTNRMHNYSRELIKYCLKRGIGKIVLNNYSDVQGKTHEDSDEGKFLLASWSYYNLSDKIKYKAGLVGIDVEVL